MGKTLAHAARAGLRMAEPHGAGVPDRHSRAHPSVPPVLAAADGGQGRECRLLLSQIGETVATRRRHERGDVVPDGSGDALYVLAWGMAKVCKPYYSGAKEGILRLLEPWDVIGYPRLDGEASADAAHQTCAEAMTACEVLKVPRVFVERQIRRRPEAAMSLARLMSSELARRDGWTWCLLPYKAEAKLANLLLLLAERFGRRKRVGTTILPRLTHEELAAMIATTRESVSGALGDLRRRGVLGREGERMVILEAAALAEVGRRRPFERGWPRGRAAV